MKILPLNSYPGRSVRLILATTFESRDGKSVVIPPGEVVDVLWVCNRSKKLLDVRVVNATYVVSVACLNVCGQIVPEPTLEPNHARAFQLCAA
jgi:hypothetical protein